MTPRRYSYPKTGYTNGQIFLCLTLNVSQVDGIAEVLTYTRPNIFNYSLPKSLSALLPNLSNLVRRRSVAVRSPPWFKLIQLRVERLEFLIFAKGPKFRRGKLKQNKVEHFPTTSSILASTLTYFPINNDKEGTDAGIFTFFSEIYADWIAPELQSSLNVQSWLNGPNPFSSNCSSNLTVHNILLKDLDGQDFSAHSDHSKWAVGTEAGNPYACIGDLNRMEHQMVRGGAVLCVMDPPVWKLLSTSITEIQPCPRKRRF